MSHQVMPQRESRLSVRVSEPYKALLAQAARVRRVNMSQFILDSSLEAARAVIVDETEFRLPPDQWEAFQQALDAPPRVIPALRKLFSEANPFSWMRNRSFLKFCSQKNMIFPGLIAARRR